MPSRPKPPFSPWRVRQVPFLATAADNPAFLAFYERRARRSVWRNLLAGLFPRSRSPLTSLLWIAFAAFILIPFALRSPFGSSRQWIIFSALTGGLAIALLRWLRGDAGRFLPRSLSDAFSVPSFNADVALDLWQCGITGRQIAEGLLLESLKRSLSLTVLSLSVITALALCALFLPSLPVIAVPYTLLVLALGMVNFRVAVGGFPCGSTKDALPPLIARWRNSDPFVVKFERGCLLFLRGLVYLPVTVVVVAGGVVVALATVAVLKWLDLSGEYPGAALQPILAVLYLYTTLCGAAFVRLFRPGDLKRLEALLAETDEAFDLYVRQEILHDPDARRPVAGIMGTAPPEDNHLR